MNSLPSSISFPFDDCGKSPGRCSRIDGSLSKELEAKLIREKGNFNSEIEKKKKGGKLQIIPSNYGLEALYHL